MDLLTGVLPAVTLAVGIVGTLLTEWIRDRLQRERESAERAAERQRAVHDRREQFEIDTSRDAFAALTRLARASTVYHMLDVQVARKHDVLYGSHQIASVEGAPEADEELMLANRELHATAVLLLDDRARELTLAAASALNGLGMPPPKTINQAERAYNRGSAAVDAAQQALATRIRDLYTAPAR